MTDVVPPCDPADEIKKKLYNPDSVRGLRFVPAHVMMIFGRWAIECPRRMRNVTGKTVFLVEVISDRSVEVSHHLFFRKGLEVVDIEATGLQSGAGVRGD